MTNTETPVAFKTKPQIIDTPEAYYELDEEGELYKNGILVRSHVKSIALLDQRVVSYCDLPERWKDSKWQADMLRQDDYKRDFINYWAPGNEVPIKIGEHVVGYVTMDASIDEDYSVTITDPRFLSRIEKVIEEDGRVRTHYTEHSSKRNGPRFVRQFMGKVLPTDPCNIFPTPMPQTSHPSFLTEKINKALEPICHRVKKATTAHRIRSLSEQAGHLTPTRPVIKPTKLNPTLEEVLEVAKAVIKDHSVELNNLKDK